jgi:hypothetical protein
MKDEALEKLEKLLKCLDESIRYDHGNEKWFYYAGTRDLKKMVCEAKDFLNDKDYASVAQAI